MYRLLAHSVVSSHCVSPILLLLFADAILCAMYSVSYVFIYVYIKVPISFNDLLSIRSGTIAW